MADEPNYYRVLGIEPTANAAAIEAAYQGRSLRFRLGQLRDRAGGPSGPSREELEQAYAVLGDPEARRVYDAAYFPAQPARRRVPVWVWAIVAVWLVAIAVVIVRGAGSRLVGDGGAIGRLAGTASAAMTPSVVAALPPTATTVAAASLAPTATATIAVVAPPTNTALPSVAPSPTATTGPTATPTSSTPSLTFRPTATEAAVPTPPTATPAPTATVAPPTPTATVAPPPPPEPTATPAPPPPSAPPPPPAPVPTATPAFLATDRIGVQVQVNLRAGPGTGYGSLGVLSPGTLLAATGESAYSGGYLWRQFRVADGRVGWVRDIDVLPVR